MGKAQTLTTTRTVTCHLTNDTDDEVDATTIEEEDWIEYKKRSTNDAMEKIENAKIRCLKQDSHKK